MLQALETIDSYTIGEGWYRDGMLRRVDHYIPFAIHLYGLVYAKLGRGDEARRQRYRDEAARFAQDFRHWFDAQGGAVPFGRSLTYRFAMGSFWGGLAFADLEALPWGEIKGLALRHLRWWTDLPIFDRDGVLSIGYGYPNLLMSEQYNSPGSPYWAMKAFLPLALPESHPFWQAEEVPAAPPERPVAQRHPGFVIQALPGHTVALSSGQETTMMRHGAEKYSKFAYSSRYAFGVESDARQFEVGAFDGMLAFSDDGRHFRVRDANEDALIADDMLYGRWRPFPDLEVETWLVPSGSWHLRLHRIRSPRALETAEGGFALPRADFDPEPREEGPGVAAVTAPEFSGILDLTPGPKRRGVSQRAMPNTNLMAPRSWVPQLRGRIEAGETVLAAAVLALPDAAAAARLWREPPLPPDLEEIEAAFRERGRRVVAIEVPPGGTTAVTRR